MQLSRKGVVISAISEESAIQTLGLGMERASHGTICRYADRDFSLIKIEGVDDPKAATYASSKSRSVT